jgi:hypothetical protein
LVLDTTIPDAYLKFTSHVEKVDFSRPVFKNLTVREPATDNDYRNCEKAANEISYQLLRLQDEDGNRKKPDYWSNDEFEGMNPLLIEIKILQQQRRGNYGFDTLYGLPAYIHALRAMKMMFPKTHITPVLADIVQLSFLGYTHNRKYLHLLGSMDAGKSSSTARLLYLFMLIDTLNTFAIVATPLVESANMTIFGDVTELYSQLCEAHPLDDDSIEQSTKLFPNANISSERRLNFVKQAKNLKGGWIAHRSLKKEGVGVGSKGKGSDTRFGHGLFIFDEINKAESFNFERDLANVSGQGWFQMHSTQNPWDEMDIGGRLVTPKTWLGWGASSFNDVRNDKPIIWPTVKGGIAYRINGMDSVNMRLGFIVYPWQFHKGKHDKVVEDYGKESPEYWSQVLGIFPGGDIDMRLLSQSKLAASRYDDEIGYTMKKIQGRVMFCDPAHTGTGDKAVVGTSEYGPAIVTNTDGSTEEKMLFVKRKPMVHVKFINNLFWTGDPTPDHTTELDFLEVGGDINDITIGAQITYEQQIAIYMAKRAREEGIPYNNIGFDYSMRPEMLEAVRMVMGMGPVAFDYNTKAIGYHLQSTNESTEERFSRPGGRTDELLYLTADLFRSKQMRGGQFMTLATIQMCQTRVDKTKAWKPAEKKVDFKKRNENKSPDERDTLSGEVGMAYLRGFRAEGNSTPDNISSRSIFRLAQERKISKRKTVKHFNYT